MIKYSFTCCGHKNIIAKHKTTLEFTKDREVSLEGDCIVGINADFELGAIKNFIDKKSNKNMIITIETIKNNKKLIQKINAKINPDFNSENEIVIRKTGFISERTLAVKADKAACDLDKNLILCLSKGDMIKVTLE